MPDPLSRVQFPVFQRVSIHGYELYPGPTGHEGLSAELQSGVNLIVGINGLGKTTLLNALFRVLSGPFDWRKRRLDRPAGTTSTELGRWKDPEFFSERVPDRAREAVITAEVNIGGHSLVISRRLATLDLVSLTADEKRLPNDEERYQRWIVEHARLDSFEDFYVLLRYLLFYLESRQPVIWDPAAQSDLLRVLFYDAELSSTVRRNKAEVQRWDSLARNLHANTLAPLREQVEELREAAASDAGIRHELAGLRAQMDGAEIAARQAEKDGAAVDERYRRERLTLEREKIRLVERVREYEFQEQGYFASLFRPLSETAQYLVMHAATGAGCLVCGSKGDHAADHVRAALLRGTCPVCDSPPEEHEQVHPISAASQRRLQELKEEVDELKEHISALQREVDNLAEERIRVRQQLWASREQLEQARAEFERLSGVQPPDQRELEGLETALRGYERKYRDYQQNRKEAAVALRQALERGETRIQSVSERITERFRDFASMFLAETCFLEASMEDRNLGQSGSATQFRFARFTPYLTSGGFGHVPQPRFTSSDVSESQKEFIDLAFRMALMSVAAEGRPGMLVIETPEASLDAAFIVRAGHMLGEFASASPGTRLIASSNLNQTHMIPVLFGVFRAHEREMLSTPNTHFVPMRERAHRVINLLKIARSTAALQTLEHQYDQEFAIALYPEQGEPDLAANPS